MADNNEFRHRARPQPAARGRQHNRRYPHNEVRNPGPWRRAGERGPDLLQEPGFQEGEEGQPGGRRWLNRNNRNDNENANMGRNNRQLEDARHQRNFNRDDAGHQRYDRHHRNDGQNHRNDGQHHRNDGQNHRNDNRANRNARYIGFRALEEMAQSDSQEVIVKVNDKKEAFLNLIGSPIERADLFVLIMQILSKVSESSFDGLKLQLLLEICNSNFILHLRNYLLSLPYPEVKARNNMYWNNPQQFWDNFVIFCDCIINMAPSVAVNKCRSLIDATSKVCLAELYEQHNFKLHEECNSKLMQLRERLTTCEKEEKKEKQRPNLDSEEQEPPEDFRQLSVVPTQADLMDQHPFLRPNIVNGGYRDVEHYLDVQFRLLREDCFGPLRDGINQYIEKPLKPKFDNIRVYRDVKFIGAYVSQNRIGSIIRLDDKTIKRQKRINWAHSKRFIFGSLLLFTKDNCNTFITATVLDRDVKLLAQGKMPVSFIDMTVGGNVLYNDDSYIMIESEVYFEPYFHVLKALQDPKFPEHIAMKQYIVHVDPTTKPPAYINPDSMFAVETTYCTKTKFKVLEDETWPTKDDLGLNTTQYEAYKLALTHEFAVIQGPPGTGKTFLGVKIAKTLIENRTLNVKACFMLVICYTNHALDQFLEAIMPVTRSIVRIGGQSRSEAMEKLNLNTLRKTTKLHSNTNRLFMEQRYNLKRAIQELKLAQERIDSLSNGVISFESIQEYAPESIVLGDYYTAHKPDVQSDPLKHWLFEHMQIVNFDDINMQFEEQNVDMPQGIDEDIYERIEVVLDEFGDENDEEINLILDQRISTTFTIREAGNKLKTLVLLYNKTENRQQKHKLRLEIVDLQSRINLFNEMDENRSYESKFRINNRTNMSRVPPLDRWALYFKWAERVIHRMKTSIKPLQNAVESANTAYEESRMMMDLKILHGVKVVGMTTSGAARLRKLLQALAPSIVIVEEAAEVLEQHIVTSLTNSCQHLILIGDHQQLRPSAAHIKLARRFNIEISLFERMITNGVHSARLGVQHRMRPEIAALISPHIYPNLENHTSVEGFPRVRGMTDNLFFLTHNYMEEKVEDSSSRSNQQEADMTLRLANYLMQQEYEPQDVTILAAYAGQMFYMRKQRENYAHLAKVKITVVDNYQGEESKIILLSLVRNNDENNIGFLSIDNRVCVALSRAREGFYIFGNIDILKRKSELWTKIAKTLEDKASLGSAMMLRCENHQDQTTTISSPKDFEKVPEGGCLLKCSLSLPCGHPCPLVCHGYDRGHNNTKCYKKCERDICDLKHPCPLLCHMKCKPCKRMVEKDLPCGHKMMVNCYKEPTDPSIKCITTVTVILPHCQHEAKKACYQNIESVKCPVPCKNRVDKCGHECRRKCHVTDDPDHERYLCEKPCAREKKGCRANLTGDRGDHQCPKKCHEDCDECNVEVKKTRTSCSHKLTVPCKVDINDVRCFKNCAKMLDCGHHCKKKCFEPCGDCQQKVKKTIPDCNHSVEVDCKTAVTRELCKRKCERKLPCGHRCKGNCNKPCDPAKCTELVQHKLMAPCGHLVALPCNVYLGHSFTSKTLLEHCTEPCQQTLACDHRCGGSCSQCRQGRLHAACTQTCHQTNICGHQCKEPCSQVCPPCKMPCEIKCPHSRCNRLCGAPCVPCQEKCSRRCRHGACNKRCGEPCDWPPCDEPCAERLACGHACRGLCGEPCPDICNLCRPNDFPKDFLGDDFEDNDKFVQMEDCPHVLEVENMDNLMTGDLETVKIRDCPFCRKPIINTSRYKDLVNKMFKTEINPIKERVYGNQRQIKIKREELFLRVVNFPDTLPDHQNLTIAFEQLHRVVITQKNVSQLQLEMQSQYLNILEMIGECYENYKAAELTELNEELDYYIETLCNVMSANTQKISQQLQQDIGIELKRMNSITQLAKLLSHSSYLSSKTASQVVEATDKAKQCVLTWGVFSEEESVNALSELQKAVNVFGIVSKQERDLIVKAIGSKAGSWYKCPNGHFYSIADCGGAVMVSKCADCGVAIGGMGHRLLADNQHAGELDGSRYAAWSDAYNNMRNFQF